MREGNRTKIQETKNKGRMIQEMREGIIRLVEKFAEQT